MPKLDARRYTLNARSGFTLIEIALSLVFILAMIVILLTASGTFRTTRKGNLQGVATKIASRQIENLRNTAFASLPNCPSPTGCSITSAEEPDLSKLPSGSATKTLDDYEASTKIKQVLIKVNWTENAAPQEIKIETLISENGL
ncbi:hypothetical protein A3I57_02975 [Candidatus Beckwithbacteria bacterium RIFCSPLOWO2_02_FULL_47_23]|uniref:Prepilin-type N-terminal cleavage/methylation domain-containing protein n=1 Tax=Candidatus Beckwithbacteria bacterium RIFCSPLOWO2_02_FULL_47_23 TaxID=1797463 RepID=A0A1F5DUY5_9BACT|nr:MAG: hypothetical protein A3I57_02975 [Candidatus Beckwithbacteria bacterium RIFCSPLOWO2_02_FULL_47_23]